MTLMWAGKGRGRPPRPLQPLATLNIQRSLPYRGSEGDRVSKAAQFRSLLDSDSVEFILEAHDGLSAKIVEEAGFKGIWASGLAISASMGLRDNNEASWTQVLEAVEFMSDATSIPIMLDADTGHGNFNNVRRLVTKLEQRHVAAMCIEDKRFPKTNSFIDGDTQDLADIDEFALKVRAAKESQQDPAFSVVARVEAFIAGWGLDEALKRAHAYREAGADAILMHSKRADTSQIAAFMKEWGGAGPVVVVPTMYPDTTPEHFRELGVSLVIFANHMLRASVTAMQEAAAKMASTHSLTSVEGDIVPVSEIFRLQNAEELREAEARFLPRR